MASEPTRGILASQKAVIGVFLLFSVCAVLSWRSAAKHSQFSRRTVYFFGAQLSHDPIRVFALGFSIFILVSIVLRSPLRVDRFVFGIVAIPFALSAVGEFASLTGAALWAVRATDALVWTIAAAICAATLATLKQQQSS